MPAAFRPGVFPVSAGRRCWFCAVNLISNRKVLISTHSIAVAGKGGTGKTTLAALIIRALISRKSGPVLVIDADPDSNLGTMLGITPAKSIGDLREESIRGLHNLGQGQTKAAYLEAGLNEVIAEAQGFDLIAMGRGEGPGCYCYLNNLIRSFSDNLMPSYAWVVMDNEAGLEHLSRRTSANIDILFVTVTESPQSVETARSIESLTRSIKNSISRKYVIANMVRPGKLDLVKQRVSSLSFEFAGHIPRDPVVEDAQFEGKPLLGLERSMAGDIMCEIVNRLFPKDNG